jgi:hypothetical protein
MSLADILLASSERGMEMQRDMDLVRKIMFEVQSRMDVEPKAVEIDGVDDVTLGRHVEMLFDAGFLEGLESGTTLASSYRVIVVTDLSWDGHDFIDAISKDGVWQKLKETFSPAEMSTMPLKVIKDASIAVLTSIVKARIGL